MSGRIAQESKTDHRPIEVASLRPRSLARNVISKQMEFGQQKFGGEMQ
jgi:hypothetical protein